MRARERIPTNGSFKDGIEIHTKWVVTPYTSWPECKPFERALIVMNIL